MNLKTEIRITIARNEKRSSACDFETVRRTTAKLADFGRKKCTERRAIILFVFAFLVLSTNKMNFLLSIFTCIKLFEVIPY